MSSEDNKSINQSFNRQSMIGNFNSWINDLGSAALTHLLNFRRRNSKGSTTFTLAPLFTRSDSYSNTSTTGSDEGSQDDGYDRDFSDNHHGKEREPGRLLNGTLNRTLKTKELIELHNFGIVEVDCCEPGVGHKFEPHELKVPTWCDSCSQFIWTPVVYDSKDTSIRIVSPFSQTIQCCYCKYTCHTRCRRLVRIDCKGGLDTHGPPKIKPEEKSEEKSEAEVDTKTADTTDNNIISNVTKISSESSLELQRKIAEYNERLKRLGSGLGLTLMPDGKLIRGFLRVHLNLTRPINVVAGTRPPSIYDIINEDENLQSRRTLTSFYMPRNTVKNIHITSEYTSLDVIKAMLKKFKVVDNPQKFALYRRFPDENGDKTLKRIPDNDFPLKIALEWCDWNERQFVLQENDDGDIAWDAFLLPELNNFLIMLDREEQEHLDQLRLKYDCLRDELSRYIKLKEMTAEGIVV